MPAPHAETADRVLSGLGSDPRRGLNEAEARARLQRQGRNELQGAPQVPRWRKLLRQFVDPLVVLLLGAVVVSLAVWLVEGSHGVPFETLAIVSIVLLNAFLGYIQEERAERAVAALRRVTTTTVAVVRDDRPRRVPSDELVRGTSSCSRRGTQSLRTPAFSMSPRCRLQRPPSRERASRSPR